MRSLLPISILLILVNFVYGLELTSSTNPIKLPLWRQPNVNTALAQRDLAKSAGMNTIALSVDKQSYYTVIQIGPVYFRVALDTASSDLWIMSTDCKSPTCSSLPRYPLTYLSDSFVTVNNNQTAFTAGYSDGTTSSGFVAKETVRLGTLSVANQTIALIKDSNVAFHDQVSGIFGLGFPRLSSIMSTVDGGAPFFSRLVSTGQIDYPLFGFNLNGAGNGTLTLGAVDANVVTNTSLISWHSVVQFSPFNTESNTSSYLQWVTPLSGFMIGNTTIPLTPTYPNQTANRSLALFDIGTNGLYGPYADVDMIYSSIEGSRLVDTGGQWAIPCDTTQTMTLQLANRNFTLRPTDYIIGRVSGNPSLCLSYPRALPPSADGVDWQIGTTFLKTVYSIFSYGINGKEAPLIGLYPLVNDTSPQTPDIIAQYLSSMSATVDTTLPNSLIPTPTFSTPAYLFNTSIPAPTGGVVSSGLAASSYKAILATPARNLSAIPSMTANVPQATVVITDHSGAVVTSIEPILPPVMTLGVPPGWSNGSKMEAPFSLYLLGLCLLWTFQDLL